MTRSLVGDCISTNQKKMNSFLHKALISGVFLLVVGVALAYFARTMFVYQPLSQASDAEPTPIPAGAQCYATAQCGRGYVCQTAVGTVTPVISTCQIARYLNDTCKDVDSSSPGYLDLKCGKDFECTNKNGEGLGTCSYLLCTEEGSRLGCVTATPTASPTNTPAPSTSPPEATVTPNPTATPAVGLDVPVCTNTDDCRGSNARPYFYLDGQKDIGNGVVGYELRFYQVPGNELASNRVSFQLVDGSSNVTQQIGITGFSTHADGYQYTFIGNTNLFAIRLPNKVGDVAIGHFVSDAIAPANFPWTIRQISNSQEESEYLRAGIRAIAPTATPTPTPTPTGFNLYIDPAGTDATLDAIKVKLDTGVRKGVRRGEKFVVRVLASPNNLNFRSEYIYMKELKIPIQYALPTRPESIIIEGIQSTGNPDCSDYDLENPQANEINTVSAFYLKLVSNTGPKQLVQNKCVAEVSFIVRNNAQYEDTAWIKILREDEASGVGEIDTALPLKGMHALAYHLVMSPPSTPVATPATTIPKVNLSVDSQSRRKEFAVDTSYTVPPGSPDTVIDSVSVVRLPPQTGAVSQCGDIKMQVVAKNISTADITQDFAITVNGQKKMSSGYVTADPKPSIGLARGTSKTFHFDGIKFNADGPNSIFVDSDDVVLEVREDNNYRDVNFVYADIPDNACPRPTSTPSTTRAPPTPTPTLTYDLSKVNIKMKVKVQGVQSNSISVLYPRMRFGVSIGGGNLDSNTDFQYFDFESRGAGVYEGVAVFGSSNIAPADNYKIIVKGPKHLAKRFCIARPDGGLGYFCPESASAITLDTGLNEFDFSSAILTAGDLPLDGGQDSILDSSDLSFIRTNLGIKITDVIRVGDLNLDGIVDTQDYAMVINNMSSNEDER